MLRLETVKLLEGNREEAPPHRAWQQCFGCDTKSTSHKSKLVRRHQTKMLPHSKRNSQQNEEAAAK